jgi:hypothetical protein
VFCTLALGDYGFMLEPIIGKLDPYFSRWQILVSTCVFMLAVYASKLYMFQFAETPFLDQGRDSGGETPNLIFIKTR